jgi:hypothetical protein
MNRPQDTATQHKRRSPRPEKRAGRLKSATPWQVATDLSGVNPIGVNRASRRRRRRGRGRTRQAVNDHVHDVHDHVHVHEMCDVEPIGGRAPLPIDIHGVVFTPGEAIRRLPTCRRNSYATSPAVPGPTRHWRRAMTDLPDVGAGVEGLERRAEDVGHRLVENARFACVSAPICRRTPTKGPCPRSLRPLIIMSPKEPKDLHPTG